MRLFLILAVVLLVLALVCLLVPTQIAAEGWQTWLVAGLLSEVVDKLAGGYVVALPRK